jgi:hypothetical protein
MQDNFETTKKINGPMAVYRMQGNVNGQKKILYLFADQHILTHRCQDVVSLDIDQHIVREFNKINNSQDTTEYDLFLETYPDIMAHKSFRSTKSYLSELRNTFNRYIDFNTETNKMTISRFGKKSRLHYIDMRNNKIFDVIFEHDKDTMYGFQIADRNILKSSLLETITKIASLITDLHEFGPSEKKMEEHMTITEFINKKYDCKKSDEYLKKIIHKIFNVYTNNNTKKIIQERMIVIIALLEKTAQNIVEIMKKIEDFWIEYDAAAEKLNLSDTGLYGITYTDLKSKMHQFSEQYSDYSYEFLNHTAQIMDMYFLRRFIDKTYVTNGIVYTGGYHTIDIIHMLINKFDFELTHSSVNKLSITDLNKNIKNIKYERFFQETKNLLCPDIFGQCVDLTGFPESYT